MAIQIHRNYSLKQNNTFGIDVTAAFFTAVHSINELMEVLKDAELKKLELLILGGGSNVLFTGNFNGLVIHNCIKGIEVVQEESDFVYVHAASGEQWHDLVLFAVVRGWGGIENLSLIPGSVGASPMQNIGAYGVEIKDTFHSLEALDLKTLQLVTFNYADCHFGYRESVFKHELRNRYFITGVTFKLSRKPALNTTYGAINQELEKFQIDRPQVKDVSDAVIRIRRSKLPDPAVLGNAGSFFKNPEVDATVFATLKEQFPELVAFPLADGNYKIAAGWMIEQCGWKGKRVGATGAHKDQALVLVNYGDANGREVQELAAKIRESVHEKFGVWITPEVNII
jgi:UDP-N-acetylmuramate dehydrogenase